MIEPQGKEIDKERGVIKEELRTVMALDGVKVTLINALGRGSKYTERNLIGSLSWMASSTDNSLLPEWYRPDYKQLL